MSKLYKENGFLSEEGERVFKEVLDGKLAMLLKQGESEEEIRLIGSLIHQRIGNAVANAVQAKKELASKFAKMTDEQFEAYLKGKYGDRWMLVSLTPEEFNRVPNLSKEEIQKALEEGRKAREAAERATPRYMPDPRIRYR